MKKLLNKIVDLVVKNYFTQKPRNKARLINNYKIVNTDGTIALDVSK